MGKWFTYRSAFRLAYDVNRSHSFIDGLHNGTNSSIPRSLYGDNPVPDENGYYTTSFIYHNLHGDFLLSPIDLITGYYNPDRFYSIIPYVGMGIACVSGHASMIKTLKEGKRNFELSANVGFINQLRITRNLDIHLTLAMTAQEYHIDTWYCEYMGQRPRFADFNYSIFAGLTWHSDSYTYELPYRYVEVIKETTEIVQHIHDTVPCQEITDIHGNDTITEIVSYPLSIFFHRDKYELMSNRDLVNLEEIAKVAIANGWTIHLRGSCDSATATPEYNQALALRRCNTIMNILMDMGVRANQIEIEPVGGVKELDPTEYDRRVLITLKKVIK